MAGLQEKTVAGLLADLGLTGFNGISAAVDGTTNTTLDITVTAPAWAVLGDGTVLAAELVTTTITGLSTNGSLHLYLDYATGGSQGSGYAPSWSVAATAPSANAIKIADVTVGSGHITAVTMVQAGLAGLHQNLTLAPTTPAFPATTVWQQNTTGADVIAYLGLSGVTATHLYVSPTNGTTGAVDLITQAATGMGVIIPSTYYFSATFSAGTPTWTWVGLRSR